MMSDIYLRLATLAFISVAFPALAGDVAVTVTDTANRPIADAVAELTPDTNAPPLPIRVPSLATIDQRHETFIPLVNLIRKGGQVVFTNNDETMHQVYSFSDIKQFGFEVHQGERSKPVVFDVAGVAAIGCNIHDQMITYVYVAAAPFARISDVHGVVNFTDIPAGSYHLTVWHPRLIPRQSPPPYLLAMGRENQSIAISIALTSPPAMKPMHMSHY
jgi:plastocyanin